MVEAEESNHFHLLPPNDLRNWLKEINNRYEQYVRVLNLVDDNSPISEKNLEKFYSQNFLGKQIYIPDGFLVPEEIIEKNKANFGILQMFSIRLNPQIDLIGSTILLHLEESGNYIDMKFIEDSYKKARLFEETSVGKSLDIDELCLNELAFWVMIKQLDGMQKIPKKSLSSSGMAPDINLEVHIYDPLMPKDTNSIEAALDERLSYEAGPLSTYIVPERLYTGLLDALQEETAHHRVL